ncbi:Pyridoxamine 5'-phosphate oxidase family protein isoform 2 [Hibiscus syriacus]|uniref:Pyridoxamine 5'-phosphate oxidase family protein isoform 2 n=1 Tax=Hibiscus syriacus TaxID=106335 RepID=A0A6A2WIR6_HIBSY|nr:Pyridoxamine 5'-phosphate oxidase family protein isoform 2 [Hibiscus syriacus]
MKSKMVYGFWVLFLLGFQEYCEGRLLASSEPDINNVAGYARWLVSQSTWGVLSTLSVELEGSPFGNVVSYSDGVPGKRSGIPEHPLGTCGDVDPENPNCAKITLTGKTVLLETSLEEWGFAQAALFTMHPEMKWWPTSHGFRIFKLEIENIFIINGPGGPKPLTVDEYLKYKVSIKVGIL